MAYKKTAHRRRRVRSSRRKNAKSRKMMWGGAFTNVSQCKAYVNNSQSNYNKKNEIDIFTNYSKFAKDIPNKANPCVSNAFIQNFTPSTASQ